MRTNLSLIVLFLLTSVSIQAQEHYCGAEYPQEMHQWLYSLQNIQDHSRLTAPNELELLPMVIHNLANDNGQGYFALDDIATMMCRMNDQFVPTGFYFYLAEDVNRISNSTWYAYEEYNVGNNMMNNNNLPDVINFYINADPAGNCGYYTYGPDAIAVKKSCAGAEDDTPSHEVGHYMSLPHPFYGWEGSNYYSDPIPNNQQERIDGTNCTTTGDLLCDTEPDYISNLWGCTPPNDMYDPNGDQVTPDTSLYMSYSNDACNTRFTEDQQFAMQQFLVQQRQDLLNAPTPDIKITVGQPEPVYPSTGSTVPYDEITLAWSSAEGLDYYWVEILTSSLTADTPPAFAVTDTFTTISLEPDVNYYWRVMAFSLTSFCNNEFSGSSFLQTSSDPAGFSVSNVDITTPNCPGQSASSATISVTGGVQPYTFDWGGADPMNLSDGLYEVLITDASGESIVYPVVIDEPDAFLIDAEITDSTTNTVLIAAVGGTAPYTYSWPDGHNEAEYEWLPTGDYNVEITDANGCTELITFSHQAVLSVFSQNVLHQQCFGTPSGSAEIEVFGGVEPYEVNWQPGVIPSTLLPGSYDVSILDADGTEIITTIIINSVPELFINYFVFNEELDQVNINVSGGVPPLSLDWSNGHTLTTYVGLESGDYSVTVTDANGCQKTVNFTYEATSTSIENISSVAIELSPNPASSIVNIKSDSNIERISIIDLNGKLLMQELNNSSIDVSNLTESIYIIKVKTSTGLAYHKLVVAR